MFDDFLSVIGALVSIVFLIVIEPFVYFWFAYLGGWIASITIGNILATGLNTMFNVAWFTKDMIPLCAGTLGWIGSFFKNDISIFGKDKD